MKKQYLFLLAIFFQLAIFNSEAQVCFTAHADYTAGTNPNTILSADLNKDGFPDIICTNGGSSDLQVFLGNGTGTFPATGNSYAASMGTQGMCIGYFNSDTFPDVAVTFFMGGGVGVMLNDSTGGFGPFTNYYGGSNPQSVTSGDFNMDGFTDLAAANYGSGNVSLYLGDGTGAFGTATNFAVAANPQDIIADDFNGDTKPDLAVANRGANNMSILIGNGTGGFAPKVNYPAGTAPSAIRCADFNADGKKDLAVANINSNNVSIFLGTGTGTFGTATNFSSTGGNPNGLAIGDYNGDGKSDLAIGTDFNNTAGVFLGNGAGSFATMLTFPTDAGPRSICSGDFNMDGKSDLATGNFSSNDISVLLSTVLPVVHASATDSSICQGSSVTLNGIGAATYAWQPPFITNGVPFSPPGSLTYTVTGTDSNGCVDSDTLAVIVNSAPFILVGTTAQTVCLGDTTRVYGGGNSVSYSWSGGVTNNVPFIPSSSATYSVTGTSAAGCTAMSSIPISVNPLPNVGANATTTTVCANGTVTLTGTGASSYTWSNAVTNGVAFTPFFTQTYTVTGTDANNCSDTATKTITVIPSPTVTANATAASVCLHSSVTLTGGGANVYTWTGGVTNGIPFNANGTQTYTVTGTDVNNCSNTATVTVFVSTPSTPDICMVTVDSLSINNIIMWDKTLYSNVDTFYVYRDTANNAYGLIGKVPYDSLSQFTDTVRNLYAANGDPSASSWRYKLAIKDTCGNIGAKSPYHQSIFMQNNTGNFSWSDYKIEGQAVPVPALNNYLFKRDDFSTGNYQTIQTLSASSVSYTDPAYAAYQATATWRIETLWSISCSPTRSIINTSRSNIKHQMVATGMEKINPNSIFVFPNPAKDELAVNTGTEKIKTIEIENALGQIVFSESGNSNNSSQRTLNISHLASGIYFVNVIGNNGSRVVKKVVKE